MATNNYANLGALPTSQNTKPMTSYDSLYVKPVEQPQSNNNLTSSIWNDAQLPVSQGLLKTDLPKLDSNKKVTTTDLITGGTKQQRAEAIDKLPDFLQGPVSWVNDTIGAPARGVMKLGVTALDYTGKAGLYLYDTVSNLGNADNTKEFVTSQIQTTKENKTGAATALTVLAIATGGTRLIGGAIGGLISGDGNGNGAGTPDDDKKDDDVIDKSKPKVKPDKINVIPTGKNKVDDVIPKTKDDTSSMSTPQNESLPMATDQPVAPLGNKLPTKKAKRRKPRITKTPNVNVRVNNYIAVA